MKAKTSIYAIPGIKRPEITIELIITAVSDDTGLTPYQIKQKTRARKITDARKICYYLIRRHTTHSLQFIGDAFNQDHATVLCASVQAKALLSNDPKFLNLKNRVESHFNHKTIKNYSCEY